MNDKGLFIVFEGIDGVGKSTQVKILQDYFEERNILTKCLKEPTISYYKRLDHITSLGFKIDSYRNYQMLIEDRKNNVDYNIKPALKKGKVVIQDRYYHSTIVYQQTEGIDANKILRDNSIFTEPDLIFILELPVNQVKERLMSKGEIVTTEELNKLEQARGLYHTLSGNNIFKIDASFSVDKVHKWIVEEIEKRFGD